MRNSLLTVAFFVSVVFGQTVNITGTVTSGGQPIQGAVVKLFVQALACTSKADGSYSLGGQVATIGSRSLERANGFTYKNKSFVFTAAEPIPASVKLYDPAGRLVAGVFAGTLQRGETKVLFPLDRIGHSVLIVHVVMGAENATYRLVAASGKSFALSAPAFTNGKLSKALAISDWLQGSKAGYAASIQPISSYTGVINITLGALSPPNFGPNTYIYDPTMSMSTIQSQIDAFNTSATQFGNQRTAYLFKPGKYSLNVTVNYYIQACGLGIVPDSVTINGSVQSRGGSGSWASLSYFWRGAENMYVIPPAGQSNIWAVSQASPFRRMHIKGGLTLSDGGATSGGYSSDCKIEGKLDFGSQQQWYVRNSVISSSSGGMWNLLLHGVVGAPADDWPNGIHTVVDLVPLVREKPFITIDGSGKYSVFVPALRTNCKGVAWDSGAPAGVSIPIDQFHIAIAGTDNAASINAALAQGKNLILTPGIYYLDNSINVVRPNTVVLGLGLATLVPANNVVALKVADVDGVQIGGILFDADSSSVPMLLQVGETTSAVNHSANPTCLFDVFTREGGVGPGKDTCSVMINSNNVVLDHCWLWRADHGTGVGWTTNLSKSGLIVNGNNVIVYGHHNEHHQQYQTVWNGNFGRNYFLQCEMPYDVPNQTAFQHDGINGWASYKVGNSVTDHEAWATGIYAYYRDAPVTVANAIETPKVPGIKFHHIKLISLSGNQGTITHVINDTGSSIINQYVGGQ
jgi:hypothetical protein